MQIKNRSIRNYVTFVAKHSFINIDLYTIITIKINTMTPNMGALDKTFRILIAIIIGLLWYSQIISGTFAIVLLVFAGIFVLTSLISFCPLYLPFGFSTIKK